MDRQPVRRRRFYVHGIQRKYIFLSLVPLIISAFLIVVFLFIPLDVLLYSSAAPAAKTAIVQDLRALGFRIWPASRWPAPWPPKLPKWRGRGTHLGTVSKRSPPREGAGL